jgi:PKD repeat protein
MKQIFSSFFVLLAFFGLTFLQSCKKPPRANFTFKEEKGGIVKFINTTAGNVDEMIWDFGDTADGTSTETNPTYRFLYPGTFNVTLSVANSDGRDQFSQDITIEEGNRENLDDHPQFTDADGYFYTRNTVEFEKSTPTLVSDIRGKAIAALYDSTNFLVSVGKVSVNGIQLTHNSDNSYSYRSPDSSFYFLDEVRWVADGGNGYPPIVENLPKSFPEVKGIVSVDTFNLRYDTTYTLKTASQILYADSIIWNIEDSKGTVIAQQRTGGGLSGVFFDVDDLTKLVAKGTYRTKVIAYSLNRKNHNFKTVYYTKETYTESQFRAY